MSRLCRRLISAGLMAACLFVSIIASAGELVLTLETTRQPLGRMLDIHEDATNHLDIRGALDALTRGDFTANQTDVPGYGFSSSAFWVTIRLRNENPQRSQWWLELAYAPMQHITVWTFAGQQPGPQETPRSILQGGSSVPLGQRPLVYRNHLFPLDIPTGETITLLVRVAGENSKTIPLTLWNPVEFQKQTAKEYLYSGSYLGVLVALGFFSLFLSSFIRESLYVLYAALLFSTLLFFLSLSGLAQQYLWGDWTALSIIATPGSMGLIAFFINVFSAQFLGIRKRLPRLLPVTQGLAFCGLLVVAACAVAPYHPLIIAATILSVVSAATLFVAGVLIARRGHLPAVYYLIAWSVFLAGITTQSLRLAGILPSTLWTEYSIFMGSAFEAILLTMALSVRIKLLSDEKSRAQQEALKSHQLALDTMSSHAKALELQVAERQQQLADTQKDVIHGQKSVAVGLMGDLVANELADPNLQILELLRDNIALANDFHAYLLDLADDDSRDALDAEIRPFINRLTAQYDTALQGQNRIHRIVSALNLYSQMGMRERRPASLNRILDDVISGLGATDDLRIDRVTDVNLVMDCYPDFLCTALTNICENAVAALRDPAPEWRSTRQPCLVIALEHHPGAGSVQITVTDNGPGMDEAMAARAFDPFTTSRAIGAGTGLGLTVARDIIKRHDGSIALHSTPGVGTRVTVVLPVQA